jgi:hypothetical protein
MKRARIRRRRKWFGIICLVGILGFALFVAIGSYIHNLEESHMMTFNKGNMEVKLRNQTYSVGDTVQLQVKVEAKNVLAAEITSIQYKRDNVSTSLYEGVPGWGMTFTNTYEGDRTSLKTCALELPGDISTGKVDFEIYIEYEYAYTSDPGFWSSKFWHETVTLTLNVE